MQIMINLPQPRCRLLYPRWLTFQHLPSKLPVKIPNDILMSSCSRLKCSSLPWSCICICIWSWIRCRSWTFPGDEMTGREWKP